MNHCAPILGRLESFRPSVDIRRPLPKALLTSKAMSEKSAFPEAHFCSSSASLPSPAQSWASKHISAEFSDQIAGLIIFKAFFLAGALTFISSPTLLGFLLAAGGGGTPSSSLTPSPLNLEISDTPCCNESFRNCYDLWRQSLHLIHRLLTSTVGSMVSSCTCGICTLQQPT